MTAESIIVDDDDLTVSHHEFFEVTFRLSLHELRSLCAILDNAPKLEFAVRLKDNIKKVLKEFDDR